MIWDELGENGEGAKVRFGKEGQRRRRLGGMQDLGKDKPPLPINGKTIPL